MNQICVGVGVIDLLILETSESPWHRLRGRAPPDWRSAPADMEMRHGLGYPAQRASEQAGQSTSQKAREKL